MVELCMYSVYDQMFGALECSVIILPEYICNENFGYFSVLKSDVISTSTLKFTNLKGI